MKRWDSKLVVALLLGFGCGVGISRFFYVEDDTNSIRSTRTSTSIIEGGHRVDGGPSQSAKVSGKIGEIAGVLASSEPSEVCALYTPKLVDFNLSKSEVKFVIEALVEQDPAAVENWIATIPENVSGFYSLNSLFWESWVTNAPADALAAYHSRESVGDSEKKAIYAALAVNSPHLAEEFLGDLEPRLVGSAIKGQFELRLASEGLSDSIEWLGEKSGSTREGTGAILQSAGNNLQRVSGFLEAASERGIPVGELAPELATANWWGTDPFETSAAVKWISKSDPELGMGLAGQIDDKEVRKGAIYSAWEVWAEADINAALSYLSTANQLSNDDQMAILYLLAQESDPQIQSEAIDMLKSHGHQVPGTDKEEPESGKDIHIRDRPF